MAKRCLVIICASIIFNFQLSLFNEVSAQATVRIRSTYAETYAATQLHDFLEKGGCAVAYGGQNTGLTVYVGMPPYMEKRFRPMLDSLRHDGYLIVSNGHDVVLHGAGEKGTLYAVYAFLEMLGYRLYTPTALVVPDLSNPVFPTCRVLSNPAFEWREVSYYYPNHSQLYADWHHLHTQAERDSLWGMYVHTFQRLIPPSRYYDSHPEWFSLNNGRRSRDGQLCLSNPELLEALCQRLADTMAAFPSKKIWSVSPNDNYNVCECENCRRLDSLYGGYSGTLLWFVNQVARRFPDKTIATLAYQYTRQAPRRQASCVPARNVLVMLCPIEVGRELPIPQTDTSFRKDLEDWNRLTDNLFIWDYVVQFRNFWNPFPNLQVLQGNLQYFRRNGARMMFEQASGAGNITSWMDIRCYMVAKLMWNPDADMRTVMADFYQGYYGDAGKYVKEIVDTMTRAVVWGDKRLDIYGFPVDGAETYLTVERFRKYDSLMALAYLHSSDSNLWYFDLALQFARVELAASADLYGYTGKQERAEAVQNLRDRLDRLVFGLNSFDVPTMMEMGISPDEYHAAMSHYIDKMGDNKAFRHAVGLRKPASPPYDAGGGHLLVDGEGGIMDYRHKWLGFWGDTLDVVVDLGGTESVREIGLDFYFYPLSWIFLPQSIRIEFTSDGKKWYHFAAFEPKNPEVLALPGIKTFTQKAAHPFKARYIRIVAEPLPEIPAWHRAAGQKPWIFTDEIIVK